MTENGPITINLDLDIMRQLWTSDTFEEKYQIINANHLIQTPYREDNVRTKILHDFIFTQIQ